GDLVGPANAASGQDNRFSAKDFEASAFAFVPKRSDHAIAVFEQRKNRVLHMDIDAAMHTVILQSANHFQACAIAHVRETRILVSAEMPLQNSSVFVSIEHGAPRFKLTDPTGRFSHA